MCILTLESGVRTEYYFGSMHPLVTVLALEFKKNNLIVLAYQRWQFSRMRRDILGPVFQLVFKLAIRDIYVYQVAL